MTPFLLDVNVLLAMCDNRHVHHEKVHAWFASKAHKAWATSPMTENGFIRILSNQQYSNPVSDIMVAANMLKKICLLPGYQFWVEDFHIWDFLDSDKILRHTQVTDTYLLSLAVKNSGVLATLDKRIDTSLVKGGTHALELIE